MNKFSIISSILIISLVFVYAMIILSDKNTCTGVRIFDCQKNEKSSLVSEYNYNELKPTGDIFLKYCKPKIKDEEHKYLLDYSECDLKVSIAKEKQWVTDVEVNKEKLTREQINSNF